jgi:hypothetical protein
LSDVRSLEPPPSLTRRSFVGRTAALLAAPLIAGSLTPPLQAQAQPLVPRTGPAVYAGPLFDAHLHYNDEAAER